MFPDYCLPELRRVIANMIALRNYGVGFSLDDFGTGQSNLNYIVDMPGDIGIPDFIPSSERYLMSGLFFGRALCER